MFSPAPARRARLRWLGVLTAAALALSVAVQQGAAARTARSDRSGAAIAITPARGTAVTKYFFGMHSPTLAGSFPAVPAGSIDLMTDGVYWPDLETPTGFDFTKLDALVEQARSNHARPLLILGQTPSFHAADPATYTGLASVPDMAAWKTYVRTVVDRYGRQLDYQIWPEPNVKPNWVGTPQQMADLVVAAAKIIHHDAPGATVVAPGMVLRLYYERVWMKAFFAQKVNGVPVGHYIDAVGVDPYPLEAGGPEDSLALVKKARRFLQEDGVDAPIWTVEVNYGAHVGSVGYSVHSSWSRQASLVARTYLLSAGVGIQRVFWLGWSRFQNLDVQMVGTDMVTPTPAAAAYALVARWLTGQHARGCFRAVARDLYSCAFVRSGRTSWVFWTQAGVTVVKAPAGARKVQKVTGAISPTQAGDRIKVGPVPVWVSH